MAEQSGTAEQIISLPKGGGALKGIGETFSADPHTGTGSFSVPVPTPPGRHGFGPELSLAYSTGTGNGPFGLGWSLSVPGVARQTSHGLPTYDDAKDTFVLSGAEDLVAVEHRPGVTRYRPRTEGMFARVEHHRGASGDFWRVWTPDGLVSTYGTPRPAGAAEGWRDPAVLADPADPGRVFGWRLSGTVDVFGNRIEYEYAADAAGQAVQTYLSRVRYADHGDPVRFLVEVTFGYEQRPDVFSDRRPTFEVRTRWRCHEITVHSGGTPMRTLRLRYATAVHNGLSLLDGVTVEGRDGDRTEALPPLEFGYTPFEPAGRRFTALRGAQLPARSLASPAFELVDLDGDGLPDFLETGGGMRYWRNLGDGRFDRPRVMRNAPAGVTLADPGVRLLDADGDGRVELVVGNGTSAGYFTLAGGEWDEESFRPYETALGVPLDDPELRLVDLDGDGVVDALRTGSRFECFFNDRERGWHTTRVVERRRYPDFPDVSFADPRVRLADLTGDGLQDIVLVHDGRLEYWPSLGRGDFAPLRTMTGAPRFGEGFDPRRVLIGDVDGDGAADVVYVDHDSVTLWVNRSGQGFAEPVRVKGTPRVDDMSAVRLVDLLGTGVAGLLFSGEEHYFLDFTGGVKPSVLDRMDNNAGALTRITYAPSTRWTSTLPFPVQVVAAVEVHDQVSGGRLTTTYRYGHGHWDGVEREFRGFGRVDQVDAEAFAGTGRTSPPLLTRTWFHQGADHDHRAEFWPGDAPLLPRPAEVDALLAALPPRARRDAVRALRGQVLRTELYELDGSARAGDPVTVTESVTGLREESPPAATDGERPRVFFPHRRATRTTHWERGTDPMTSLTFDDDFDGYGNPRSRTTVAVPRGRDPRGGDPGTPCLIAQSVSTFAGRDDDRRYLTGRLATATGFELLDDGTRGVPALHAAALRGDLPRRVVSRTVNRYDGEAFEGLPAGELGEHGVLSRGESLVLTEEILAAAYGTVPPYLTAEPQWTDDHPPGFRERTAPYAGYVPRADGLYAVTRRQRFDVHGGTGRGLLLATMDPLGALTTVEYDEFALLPVRTTDAAGLVTGAAYDYRTFQPREVTDPNGNRTAAAYTPLGLLERTAVMGRPGEATGDTLDAPTTRLVYDLAAFAERGEPVSVLTIRRVHHAHSDVPAGERDETVRTVEFTDGFGRLSQTRTQAEEVVFGDPGSGGFAHIADPAAEVAGVPRPDRVVVSGWQVYDNKGRVVEKYEPFHSTGYSYAAPAGGLGRRALLYYDARGRLVRTVNPDGSQQRVVHGRPVDLADPDRFTPTAWETFTYDANDNAGRTHPAAAQGYRDHWDTPASVLVDALGRTVEAVSRNGSGEADRYTVRYAYDIRGNLLTLTDERGRVAFEHTYDLAGGVLRTAQLDAGVSRVVLDAAGRAVEVRDAREGLVLHGRDAAGRPVRAWARDAAGQPVTLRQVLVYGGAADHELPRPEAAAANLLGVVVRHYDEAGLATVERRDLAGNVVEATRHVVADGELLSRYEPAAAGQWRVEPWRMDWQPAAGTTLAAHAAKLLDPEAYRTSSTFDALGRLRSVRLPSDVDGHRAELRPGYNRAGALERVSLDGVPFVERVAYDAKGRRSLVAYGNGVLTRYCYDPATPHLARLLTQRAAAVAPSTYRPGRVLQDYTYTYDLAGNPLTLLDRSPGSGVPANPEAGQLTDRALAQLVAEGDALIRRFAYDPRGRLVSATGREHDLPAAAPPWLDQPGGTDVTRTRTYTEHYTYDDAGNLVRLRHATAAGATVRELTPGAGNRLASLTVGGTVFAHTYDAAGNLTGEGGSRFLEWDHAHRLVAARTQAGDAEPSSHAQYLYDAAGSRVKKLVRTAGGGYRSTTYAGQGFEHHRHVAGTVSREENTLHVLDGASRIALVRVGTADPDDRTPPVRYQLGDHLDSACLVLDAAGEPVNREEYSPYGETTFGSYAHKRYRFTGKERDRESGLSYHGARYYAPWLCRWVSCDPAGAVDGANLYAYVRGNPMRLTDPQGRQSVDKAKPAGSLSPVTATTTVDTGHTDGTYDTMEIRVHGATQVNEPGIGAQAVRVDAKLSATSSQELGTLVRTDATLRFGGSGDSLKLTASGTFFARTVEPMPHSVAESDRWIAETVSRSLGVVRFDVTAGGVPARLTGKATLEAGRASGSVTARALGIPLAHLSVKGRVSPDLAVTGSFRGTVGLGYTRGWFTSSPTQQISGTALTIGNTYAPDIELELPSGLKFEPRRPTELAGPKLPADGTLPKGPMLGFSYTHYGDGALTHAAVGVAQGNNVDIRPNFLGVKSLPVQIGVSFTTQF